MLPITSIPTEMSTYCKKYEGLFNRPQYRHFENYITGFFVSEKANIRSISGQVLDSASQSSLNRFLTSSKWDSQKLNEERIKLLESDDRTKSHKDGSYILDDSLIEKYGQMMEQTGTYWDHSKKRYIKYGHNLVTGLYADLSGNNWIHDFRLYVKKDYLTEDEKKTFKSKIEFAQDMVKDSIEQGINFRYVIFDCWYLSKDMAEFVKGKGLHYISELRSNRQVWVHENRQYVDLSTYIKLVINPEEMRQVTLRNHRGRSTRYRYYTKVCRVKGLGKVRIVFTQVERNDGWTSTKALITSAIDHDVITLIKNYALRWEIEVFHRDEKQSLGLGDYSMQTIKGIKRHWYLSLVAHTFATILRIQSSLVKSIAVHVKTVGQATQFVKERVLQNFISFIYDQSKKQIPLSDIFISCKINPNLIFAKL